MKSVKWAVMAASCLAASAAYAQAPTLAHDAPTTATKIINQRMYKEAPFEPSASGFSDDDAAFLAANGTTPVTIVVRARVIRTGPSSGADGSAATIRSTIDDANMPVIAAVELSGPATANGNELPSPMAAARTADEMKVAATP